MTDRSTEGQRRAHGREGQGPSPPHKESERPAETRERRTASTAPSWMRWGRSAHPQPGLWASVSPIPGRGPRRVHSPPPPWRAQPLPHSNLSPGQQLSRAPEGAGWRWGVPSDRGTKERGDRVRVQKDKFGGRKKKKLEEEDRTKVSRRRAAGAGVGTHAAEQRAGAQAGPHGGSGAGSRRGARQSGAGRGIRSGSGRPGLAPPLGPLAPPGPAPPAKAARCWLLPGGAGCLPGLTWGRCAGRDPWRKWVERGFPRLREPRN